MKNIGFVISTKENEKRRAIIPKHMHKIKNINRIYIEKGYGKCLGYSDEEYESLGCKTADKAQVLKQDIICDVKVGDADYIKLLYKQTIFGWVHAVQNKTLKNMLINNKITAYAWENMFEHDRHIFYRNNELAGEAAVMQAFQCYGIMPYNTKVAILGRGNTARGALKILTSLGAEITVYNRKTIKLFQKELGLYDVVVNALLWDVTRKDHII